MRSFTKMLGAMILFAAGSLTASAADWNISLTPSNTRPVQELEGIITVTIRDKAAAWNTDEDAAESGTIRMKTPDGATTNIAYYKNDFDQTGGKDGYPCLKFVFPETYTQEGVYTFSTNPGNEKTLYFGGMPTDNLEFSYTIGEDAGDYGPELPEGITVKPDPGTYEIKRFGGYFFVESSAAMMKRVEVKDEVSGEITAIRYDCSVNPEKNKIRVSFPNGSTKEYTPVIANDQALSLYVIIPESDFVSAGVGEVTFTALFDGVERYNSTTLPDFSWKYTLEDNSGSTVGASDEGVPAGTSIYTDYGSTFLPEDGIVKRINMFELVFGKNLDIVTYYQNETACGKASLYRKVDGNYTEALETVDIIIDTRSYRPQYAADLVFKGVTKAGDYRVMLDFDKDMKVRIDGVDGPMPLMSFDVTISSKPAPVKAQYAITPAAGTYNVADMPSVITIDFTNADYINAVGLDGTFTVTDPEGELIETAHPDRFAGGTRISLIVPEWSMNGKYKLTFNPSALKGTAPNDADLIFEPIEWEYTIKGNWVDVPANVTITPAPGNLIYTTLGDRVNVKIEGMMAVSPTSGNPVLTIGDKKIEYKGGQQTGDNFNFEVPASTFAEGGEFKVEFDANGCKFYGVGNLPETFNWIWNVYLPVEEPELLVNGEPTAGEAVEVEKGASVSFAEPKVGTIIYYSWTPEADTFALRAPAEGFNEYKDPIVVESNGTLKYYAENPSGTTNVRTVKVTLKEASETLPEGVAVSPAPGKVPQDIFTGTITVEFGADKMIMYGNAPTLTINGTPYASTSEMAVKGGKIVFNVPADIFENGNTYTCEFKKNNASGFGWTMPETFIFTYVVDNAVGVDGIVIEVSDAEYYTIEGVKVQNPEAGKIYIKVAEGKATKVLVK